MRKIYLIFLTVLFVGCITSNQENSVNKPSTSTSNEKEAIKATLIDMWDAIEKGDINRYASYIHKDFTQFGENDTILRSGKIAEIKGIKDWVDSSSPIHTQMHEPKVTINKNTAWITYYWSDLGTTNGKPFATRGKSTRIFIKENGKWLCIHGHYTLLPSK